MLNRLKKVFINQIFYLFQATAQEEIQQVLQRILKVGLFDGGRNLGKPVFLEVIFLKNICIIYYNW